MMQAMTNVREDARLQYERDRQWRELERHAEMMKAIYTAPSYRIQFSVMLPEDRVMVVDNVIHVPESQAYKFIFMNNNVSDQNIQFAINHAISKVNRFIDNYKA